MYYKVNMKVMNINSGLGNQMFQYAFILNYKMHAENISLDIIETDKLNYHNGYELDKVFGIQERLILETDKRKFLGPIFYIKGIEFNFYKLVRKIFKKLTLGKFVPIFNRYIQEDEMLMEYNFNPKYLEIKKKVDSYFFGFFASYKYFENIQNEVRKTFTFKEILESDKDNFETLEKIKNSESISVHVRRGDYVKLNNFNICDLDYYKKAVAKVLVEMEIRGIEKSKINFYIFSDDINWCKSNFNFLDKYNTMYIDWNKDQNSYKDMQLMSECKHNIIPNSTFSWWGAWLNQNKNKIVIVPKYWFKDILNSSDRCPNNWFRI